MSTETVEPGEQLQKDGRRLYTPAMLADLLKVSVRTVRRWNRAGLLAATEEVMQLPYFDYRGLATAKRLALWMQQGATVASIQTQLEQLRSRFDEPVQLEDLPITADGKKLVLRAGDQYVESSGQFRFGFDTPTDAHSDSSPATIQFQPKQAISSKPRVVLDVDTWPEDGCVRQELSREEMIDAAVEAEDEMDFETAIDWYRATQASHGPTADICFQIAELLYRCGDLQGARERYYVALELNPDLLEARANLGCVLAEDGQLDLAVAAFEGALDQFADYADVHFHLARVLDEQGGRDKAEDHWRRFIELAPASPWAEEAQQRLNEDSSWLDF